MPPFAPLSAATDLYRPTISTTVYKLASIEDRRQTDRAACNAVIRRCRWPHIFPLWLGVDDAAVEAYC